MMLAYKIEFIDYNSFLLNLYFLYYYIYSYIIFNLAYFYTSQYLSVILSMWEISIRIIYKRLYKLH